MALVRYVTRAEWGARAPLGVTRISMPTAKVYIHHTAGSERGAAGMRAIQNGHMKPVAEDGRGFRDIAYSFVIDGDDGVIYEGRGPGVKGGHVTGAENNHHGVCLMGNYENETLTGAAYRALVDLLRHGRDRGWWLLATVVGHSDEPGAQTACPGDHLYARLPALRREVTSPAPGPTPDVPVPEEPDMPDLRLLDCPGRPALLFGTGTPQRLNKAQRDAVRTLGIAAELISTATHDALASLIPPVLPVDVDETAIADALFARLGPLPAGNLDVAVLRAELRGALHDVHAAAAAAAAS